MLPVRRIVSGGQTGVDRAALDVALELGIPCGGWCPAGRAAEDGRIPERYPLRETPSSRVDQRTRWNVRDSDATLILAQEPLEGGTEVTRRIARTLGKPHHISAPTLESAAGVRIWLLGLGGPVLNVAGPRESSRPGVYHEARHFLIEVLRPEAAVT